MKNLRISATVLVNTNAVVEKSEAGNFKNIDSNWTKMADWQFGWSIALALVGDALVCLGFYSLGMFGLTGMVNLLKIYSNYKFDDMIY